jgi:nucleoside-diphosphate-sugar epimerase
MNILVTGASGYIGSMLVPMLKEKNFSVFGIDKALPSLDIDDFVYFSLDDLSQININDFLKSKIDTVIHLAGEARVDLGSDIHNKDNYLASKNLFEWAVKNRVKKIIMLSTIKIIDQGSYAKSKKKSENLLIELCNKYNAKYTILRSTPVYGEGMKGGFANWLKRYTKVLIPDVRNSESVFRMIGAYDLCTALIFCLENPAVDSKIYEISDNIDYKIREIDRFMKSVIGHDKKYIQLPKWLLWLASKLGDLLNTIGLNTPFSTDRYQMLYKNIPQTDCSFFKQHGLVVKESFMEQIPLIIGKEEP